MVQKDLAHDAHGKPVMMDAVSDTDGNHDYSDTESTARRRRTGKSTDDGPASVTDHPAPPTQRLTFLWNLPLMVAIVVAALVLLRGYRHELAMKQPVSDLLQEVEIITSSKLTRRDPVDVINLMDNEKFQHRTGAFKFVCQASNVQQTMMSKLKGSLLPAPVVNSIAESMALDEEVSMNDKKFAVDGPSGEGHSFQYRIRSSNSDGKISVALMYSSISFNMQKVVVGYETTEEPVYETERVEQNCGWFSCTPGKSHKRLVRMATTKIPKFRQSALPKGVNQDELVNALDVLASREAVKVLSR